MKVLYLINTLGAGGAEQSLVELVPALRSMGIDVSIATLDGRRRPGTTRVERGIETISCGGKTPLQQIVSVSRAVRERRPDIVHTSLFDADVVGRVAGRREGVPVLTSLVNTSYDPVRFTDPAVRAWRLGAVRAVDSWTARRWTTRFHAITHAVKDSAVTTMGLDPDLVTVVERGRSTDRLGTNSALRRREARRSLGLPEDARIVVTVGRQEWQKGQDVLVRAFDQVADHREDCHLLLVGRPGHATSTVRREIDAARNGARIHDLGHRDDVADVICAADCFAFPSRYEGLGGSLVEAMALEMPVVASSIPALEEVVERGGNAVLVPPDSVSGLAEGLATLLDDAATRAAYAARSGAIFRERFTLEKSVRGLADLYGSVGDRR